MWIETLTRVLNDKLSALDILIYRMCYLFLFFEKQNKKTLHFLFSDVWYYNIGYFFKIFFT